MNDLFVIVIGVNVDRKLSDAVADRAVFMRIPGIYAVLPLVTRNYDS